MKLSAIPKFDRSVFTKTELADLQQFADLCQAATSVEAITEQGAELDERRAIQREHQRLEAKRSMSLVHYHKRLIKEVPRPRSAAE